MFPRSKKLPLLLVSALIGLVASYAYVRYARENTLFAPKVSENFKSPPRTPAAAADTRTRNQVPDEQTSILASNRNEDYFNIEDVKRLAASGNPQSQRRLSEIYDYCMPYALSPDAYLESQRVLADLTKDKTSALGRMRFAREVADRCKTVDAGEQIPLTAVTSWLDEAVRNGDLAARARALSLAAPMPAEPAEAKAEIDSLVNDILKSGDLDAMFELETLLSTRQLSSIGASSNLGGSEVAGMGWSVAACRLGSSRCTDPLVLASRCFALGVCNQSNYEQLVLNGLLAPADRSALEARVQEILTIYKSFKRS